MSGEAQDIVSYDVSLKYTGTPGNTVVSVPQGPRVVINGDPAGTPALEALGTLAFGGLPPLPGNKKFIDPADGSWDRPSGRDVVQWLCNHDVFRELAFPYSATHVTVTITKKRVIVIEAVGCSAPCRRIRWSANARTERWANGFARWIGSFKTEHEAALALASGLDYLASTAAY
jgi:hypothetical protein